MNARNSAPAERYKITTLKKTEIRLSSPCTGWGRSTTARAKIAVAVGRNTRKMGAHRFATNSVVMYESPIKANLATTNSRIPVKTVAIKVKTKRELVLII